MTSALNKRRVVGVAQLKAATDDVDGKGGRERSGTGNRPARGREGDGLVGIVNAWDEGGEMDFEHVICGQLDAHKRCNRAERGGQPAVECSDASLFHQPRGRCRHGLVIHLAGRLELDRHVRANDVQRVGEHRGSGGGDSA